MDSLIGPFSAFLSSLTWAVGVSYYSELTKSYPPFVINFNRAVVSLALFLLVLFSFFGLQGSAQALLLVDRVHIFWLVASIVASYALGDVLFLISTESLGVPASLAIASIYPVWSALAGWVFKDELLKVGQLLGLGGVITGVILVILSRQAPPKATEKQKSRWQQHYLAGVGLALAASFFWSLNTFAVAQGARGLNTVVASVVRMAAASLLCPLIAVFFVGKISSPLLKRQDFFRGLGVFIFEGFGGSLFYLFGLTHSKLAVGSALSSLAPALSIPITLVTKTDRLTPKKLIGISVIVVGIWFLLGGK